MELKAETDRASEMLKGKIVAKVVRHRRSELLIEFTDGLRLFIDAQPHNNLELSITRDGQGEN